MPNYHLCFTSHKEVLFRDEEDMNHGFNSLCSSLYKTDSACYAYVSMSDHHHGCYRTRAAVELIRAFRESHTKYLNRKYGRKGEMGEAGVYIQEISGIKHFLAAVSYVLKNPPHHGVASSPFEYPYSSANDYFQKELGKNLIPEGLLSYAEIKAVLPRRADFDPSWKMGRNGVFLSASVLDISAVETNFGTAQAFNYYMYTKRAAGAGFAVHTPSRKDDLGRCARGMYKRTALQGRFCVHTRYVPPGRCVRRGAPRAKGRNHGNRQQEFSKKSYICVIDTK